MKTQAETVNNAIYNKIDLVLTLQIISIFRKGSACKVHFLLYKNEKSVVRKWQNQRKIERYIILYVFNANGDKML